MNNLMPDEACLSASIKNDILLIFPKNVLRGKWGHIKKKLKISANRESKKRVSDLDHPCAH